MIQKLLLSVHSVFLKFSDPQTRKTSNPVIKLACLGMFLVMNLGYGQVYWDGSTGDRNWNNPANWSSNAVPTILEDVIILDGTSTNLRTVNINTAAVCKTLTISAGANINTVTIIGSNSLTVSGAVNINAGTGNGDTKYLDVAGGSFSCASITIATSGSNNRRNGLKLSSGTVEVFGNITMNNGNNDVLFSGSGLLKVGGTISTSGVLTPSTGTVEYNNTGAQTIADKTYYNLVLSGNAGAVKTFSAGSSTNSLAIKSGVVANLGTSTHNTNTLTFAGVNQDIGSWGSSNSVATYKNDTYFASTSGIVTVGRTYPSFNFSNVRPITNVVFNALSNASSALLTSPAYENYTNYKTSVTVGQSYTLTVQGNTDGDYTYYYQVFFDWNQDGDFSDSGEPFNISTIRNSNGIDGKTASKLIAVPLNAALGTTRMRIISHYNSYNTNPLASVDGNSYGQVEDYSINIEGACSTPAPGATLSTANPVCSNVPFTLSVENPSTGGTSYQWETSTDNVTWNNATPGPVTIIDTDFSTAPTNAITLGNTSITGGELILTPAVASRAGGYFINTSPGSNITPFTASFDFRMFDGDAADGMSLSYGPANSISNSTAGGGEEGEGTGFILKLDTYDNVTGVGSGSMIRIFYAGSQIFANSLNPFNLRNASYRTANLTVDVNGLLSLKIGPTTIVSGLSVPGYVAADKTNWKFKFSGRTGQQYDKQSIDRMTIVCGDVSSSNLSYTTTQVVPTRYRAKLTCGSTSVYSTPVLVNMISAVIQPKTASTCSNTVFTVTPTSGANDNVPSGTSYSWPSPVVTGGLTGGAASSGSPNSITGTLTNSTATDQTATYTVTPTSSGCTGNPFTVTVTVSPIPTLTVGTITQPTCTVTFGSIALSGLPSGGTLTRSPGAVVVTYTGTAVTDSNLAAGTYTYTVGNGTCTSLATAGIVINPVPTATYSAGAWSSTPTIDKKLIFNSNFTSTGDVAGCTCEVNSGANVVIGAGHTLKIANDVKVYSGGTLTFKNTAALVQTNNVTNTGDITYERTTPPILLKDYVYWSTPVSPQTLINLSPSTPSTMYYGFDGTQWVRTNRNDNMVVGKGYIIRAPSGYSNSFKTAYPASFKGVPNNGNIETEMLASGKNYLIGNPYPSALSAERFVSEGIEGFIKTNENVINGTLYFWTHNTPAKPVASNQYTSDDYASFNLTGATAAESGGDKPTGEIAAGQSFFLTTKAAGKVLFTNAMRLGATDNGQFFRPGNASRKATIEKNRIWLNMTSTTGAFKQLLLGYIEGATNDYETLYDGLTLDGNQFLDFYSVSNTNKFVIQGRALPFAESDIVPLGYRTAVAGDFTIAIDEVDGKMSNQKIYVEDKTTGVIHDLTQSNYTFKTEVGNFTERLVLRYTNKTLGVGDFENVKDGILVSIKDKVIAVQSSKENIKEVTVYDVSGKMLYNKKKVGNTELQIQNLSSSNQVLLIKVTLANDFKTTRKVIFQ